MTPLKHFDVYERNDVTVAALKDTHISDAALITSIQEELCGRDERPGIEPEVPGIVQRVRRKLDVDFRAVEYASTALMNSMLLAWNRLLRQVPPKEIELCNMSEQVRRAYRILNLDGTVFTIHGSEEVDHPETMGESQ